jgi:peptidoglycan/LPS O-acetylase OafA/YrhL
VIGGPRFLIERSCGLRERFYSIDILRGLAAFSVILFHYHHFVMGFGNNAIPVARLEEVSLLRNLRWFRDYGPMAVPLFWTISGFVFMNIYAGRNVDGRTFFVNRFARLYPLHFVTLLAVAAIQLTSYRSFGQFIIYGNNSVIDFILHLFFASSWFASHSRSFNAPIWSVSIEVLIYAAFWCYARFSKPNLLSALALTAAFLAGTLMAHSLVVLCGAFFFAGTAGYCVVERLPERRRGLVALLSAGLCIAWAAALSTGVLRALPLVLQLLPLFVPLLLCLVLTERAGMRPLYRRFEAIGEITYSIYLWHLPLQMLFLLAVAFGLVPISAVLRDAFVIGYVVVVVAVAYASYRLIERPAQDFLRARLLRRREPVVLFSAP